MRKEKTLIRLLHGLVDLLAEESARNSEFASKLDTLLSELPEKKRASKRLPAMSPPEHLPDIYEEWNARGEADFRLWLRDQPIPALRALIRAEDMDPTRRTSKWKEAEKLAEFIADSIRARQLRGSAFIGRNMKGGHVSMEDEKRTVFIFPCPNCSEMASPAYTKRHWRLPWKRANCVCITLSATIRGNKSYHRRKKQN